VVVKKSERGSDHHRSLLLSPLGQSKSPVKGIVEQFTKSGQTYFIEQSFAAHPAAVGNLLDLPQGFLGPGRVSARE